MARPQLTAALWLALGGMGCAGTQHLVIAFPSTSAGNHYVCGPTAADGQPTCRAAAPPGPTDETQSHTVFVTLPVECKTGFNRVVIHDVSASSPTVNVTCAPWENPIGSR